LYRFKTTGELVASKLDEEKFFQVLDILAKSCQGFSARVNAGVKSLERIGCAAFAFGF
jgi:hypothetical protein